MWECVAFKLYDFKLCLFGNGHFMTYSIGFFLRHNNKKKIRNVFMSTAKVIMSENKYFLGAICFECAAPAIVITCKEA